MNAISGKTVLAIYNSALTNYAAQIGAQQVLKYAAGSFTAYNTSGVSKADLSTWVGTLTAGTYDNIYIMCDRNTHATGAAGKLDYDDLTALRLKLKTPSQLIAATYTGTATAGASFSITLAVGSSAVNDFYNGYWIEITAGTDIGDVAYCYDYTGSSRALVPADADWATNPDNTSVYKIGAVAGFKHWFANDTTTNETQALLAWRHVYANNTEPLWLKYIGLGGFAQSSGTAQAVAAGTITLAASNATGDRATGHTTNDYYNNMYVYVYSSTLGKGAYRKITDYVGATQVATLESNWTVTPTGTVIYRVVETEAECGIDAYAKIATLVHLASLTDATVTDYWQRLLDNYENIADKTYGAPAQDMDLIDELVAKGKAIYEAIAAAITSIPA